MKLVELLEVTTKYLAEKKIESPRLTCELILAEILGKTRLQLYLDFEQELDSATLDRLRPLVKSRAEGVPLAQVLGVTTFHGTRYKVTPDVLIPRPETEILLEAVIPLLSPTGEPVVDVGTGSGILAVEIARRFPDLQIHGVDISEAALTVARGNGQHLPNLSFGRSDLLAAMPVPHAQLIMANLPYIETNVIPQLTREVQHDPRLALDGGADGLDLIRRLIPESRGKTKWLALEIGDHHAPAVTALLAQHGYTLTQTLPDLRNFDRVLIATFSGN